MLHYHTIHYSDYKLGFFPHQDSQFTSSSSDSSGSHGHGTLTDETIIISSDDSDDGQEDLSRRLAIAAIGSSEVTIETLNLKVVCPCLTEGPIPRGDETRNSAMDQDKNCRWV